MSDGNTKNVSESITETEQRFTKSQLVKSKRFKDRRDILSALLDGDTEYTISQAEAAINKYLKGRAM